MAGAESSGLASRSLGGWVGQRWGLKAELHLRGRVGTLGVKRTGKLTLTPSFACVKVFSL